MNPAHFPFGVAPLLRLALPTVALALVILYYERERHNGTARVLTSGELEGHLLTHSGLQKVKLAEQPDGRVMGSGRARTVVATGSR